MRRYLCSVLLLVTAVLACGCKDSREDYVPPPDAQPPPYEEPVPLGGQPKSQLPDPAEPPVNQ